VAWTDVSPGTARPSRAQGPAAWSGPARLELALHPGNTEITFVARLVGFPVRGWFEDFEGALCYDENDLECSTLSARMRASSIRTGIRLRDAHLRGPSYLHAATHPVIEFRSRTITRRPPHLVVRGALALHGTVREEEIRCTSCPTDGASPGGFLLTGDMVLRRTLYGVGRPSRLLGRLDPSPHLIGDVIRIRMRVYAGAR
jgi:polyisoprenoid-binding protein YceI